MIVALAALAPLAALAAVAGMALSPATRARADAAPAALPAAKPAAAPKLVSPPSAPAPEIEPGMTLKRVLDTGGPI
jgi:hypothetical protein